MPDRIGAVITGGDFQGLGVLRTLAEKKIPIILLDNEQCIGRFSRFKKQYFKSPSPHDEGAYVNFLIDLAKKERIHGWVVFPNSDAAVYVLSRYKADLEEFYRVSTPRWEVIQNVYVKERTYQLAEKWGIPIPRTYYPKGLPELEKLKLEFPVVIKPSIRDHFYEKTKIKALRVNNKEQLIKGYQSVCRVIDPSEILVQEYIPGGPKNLYSFCPFFKDGKVLTSIMGRRSRQHPMEFGHASTFVELVNIPELKSIAEKFLGLIGFYGIGEVEFMQDPRDGQYKLLEMNPRVWGWHSLAIAAGVNLPYLLYQDMVGEKIEIPPSPKEMKWVRLTTDIPTVIMEIVKGRMKVGEYLKSMRGKKEEAVFSVSDPLPFVMEMALLPYLWIKRGF